MKKVKKKNPETRKISLKLFSNLLNKLLCKCGQNPLDSLLKKASEKKQKKFLLFWNRGLGDIALGLYAIVYRIRSYIPDAKITFLTRENLKEGFILLNGVNVLTAPNLKRNDCVKISELLEEQKIDPSEYDVIIENPDPTKWVKWQLGKLTPELHWQKKWDRLWKKFPLEGSYIGAHVQTETNYAIWRDWPIESWQALLKKVTKKGKKVLLFGFEPDDNFSFPGVVDLRGKTNLFELLSIIKHCCETLIVPDSGISSMIYYLKEPFPIKHISLWSDPYMGILKQNVASPNPHLKHIPIIGEDQDISNITVKQIYEYLY